MTTSKIVYGRAKGKHVRSLLELQESIEKKTEAIVYRIRNDYRVDPELSKDLHDAVDAFLAKADERISGGQD